MINWIEKTQENMVKFGVYFDKRLYVFVDTHNVISFKDGVLATHFALKSEYLAILPNAQKHDELPIIPVHDKRELA